MKKTIGGDRISSGKKMQVELHPYERSTHNRNYIWRNTQSPGTIVPFMVQVGTPGSTFDINLNLDVMTHPTVGPGFMHFDLNAHVFLVPIRLYHAWLHNNKLKIGLAIQSVKLPTFTLAPPIQEPDTNIDNTQINPSCIFAYLGIRGIGYNTEVDTIRSFNAIPWLGYWDIIKNYYTNKQEEVGGVIQGTNLAVIETIDSITIDGATLAPAIGTITPITLNYGDPIVVNYTGTAPDPTQILIRIVGTGGDRLYTLDTLSNDLEDDVPNTQLEGTVTNYIGNSALSWQYESATDTPLQPPKVVMYPLANLDLMREEILAWPGPGPFIINNSTVGEPYAQILSPTVNDRNPRLNTQEGLAVRTYKSDLLNNWLNQEWIDDINSASNVSTVGNLFSIDQLNMAQKMYKYLNRIGISGGSYKDWMEATYTHINFQQTESPIYLGGLMKGLAFQEVVSNSESTSTTGPTQPLGTLAGKGVMTKKHKGGTIRAKLDELCYVIGLFDITPNIDYSQGNNWDVYLETLDDFHKPQFDQIGFQNLQTYQMAWWDSIFDPGTLEWVNRSAGKQPAWLNYMTEINKCYGNFAVENSEMFMTLNRRYERSGDEIADLTTYIDPVKYNYIFADTSIDAMNFWVNMAVNIEYRGKMSGKLMPNV